MTLKSHGMNRDSSHSHFYKIPKRLIDNELVSARRNELFSLQ